MSTNRFKLLAQARTAKRRCAKGYLAQLREILALRLGLSALGASEYYQFSLFDDSRFSAAAKRSFLGWRGRSLMDTVFNRTTWHAVTSDKVLTCMLLERLGLPFPRVRAVFDRSSRAIPGVRYLVTRADFADFLEHTTYPLFVKPNDAANGRGAFRVEGFDAERETLHLFGQDDMPLQSMVDIFGSEVARGSGGYLFQETVRPSSELGQLIGDRLAGLRLIVLTPQSGEPTLTHAVLKIPAGRNVTDNFDGGRTGNMLAAVDLTTGRVGRVLTSTPGGYRQVEAHPDTGASFREMKVPSWERYRSLVLSAASVFPGLRLQHWDVAIGEDGPEIIELNVYGSLELPQIAYQQGFFDGPIRDEYRKLVSANSQPVPDSPFRIDSSIRKPTSLVSACGAPAGR